MQDHSSCHSYESVFSKLHFNSNAFFHEIRLIMGSECLEPGPFYFGFLLRRVHKHRLANELCI